jgi:anti-sigma regulatory factor (Ser/Thr protein kinase)
MTDSERGHRDLSANLSGGDDGRPELPWTETFSADPEDVKQARDATCAVVVLLGSRVAPDVAALLVSELATNARRYGAYHLTIDRPPRKGIRVTVIDAGSRTDRPQVRHPSETETSGRGLLLVQELSDRWGDDAHPSGGRAVWFELYEEPEPTGDRDPLAAVAPRGGADISDDR